MKTRLGISGSVLKWFAILSMAIDHFGASILEVFLLNIWGNSPTDVQLGQYWESVVLVDQIFRMIGRIAFPIFCFLLVQGFLHTRNVRRYALRLGIFALISEIPFDLAIHARLWEPGYQNVFLTLLLGLLTLWGMERLKGMPWAAAAAALAGAVAAEALHTDYGAFGILLIVALYLTEKNRALQCILGAVLCVWELTAVLAFVLIYLYNGERGKQPRWFFYWFYPAHLFLYYLAGAWIIPFILRS